MTVNCETCTRHQEPVPFIVHESAMARMERTIRRLWVLLLVMLVLLVGSNALWIYYESQWEVIETSETYEAKADGGGNAIANGSGVVNYGIGESDEKD